MSQISCAQHPDRTALAYCAGCGKALCGSCVVRLSAGNYCQACAETPDLRPIPQKAGRSRRWLWVVAALAAIAILLAMRIF